MTGGAMAVRELYARIVGEGGCPPDYFLYNMTACEARDYLEGLERRHRQGWEMTRALMGLLCKAFGGGELGMKFPWDKPEGEATAEDLARLRRMAKAVERGMKAEKGKGEMENG